MKHNMYLVKVFWRIRGIHNHDGCLRDHLTSKENFSDRVLQKDAAKRAAFQAQQSPKLRAIYEATQLINALDEQTEDLEAGLSPQGGKSLHPISDCLTGWRELQAFEIQALGRGHPLHIRRRQSEDPGLEVQTVMKLMATGEPSSQYLLWEVSDGTDLHYFDLLQTDLAVSVPCNISHPVASNTSNVSENVLSNRSDDESIDASEIFADLPGSETTGWPGCIDGISRRVGLLNGAIMTREFQFFRWTFCFFMLLHL